MTFIYTDRNGVEWAVTSYGMTRLFRKRTLWARFTTWLWTWIDRHGARGYVVEERTSNGGWKVTHDVP